MNTIIKRAYSLLEMAIVILIISILATGALSVYFSLDSGIKEDENEKKFSIIYKAIGKYVHENGALPCPASINVARRLASSTSFGVAGTAGICQQDGVYLGTVETNLAYGMIPVQDLELELDYALDAYGNKFTYIVDKRFTSSGSTDGFGSIYPATSIMTVNDKAGGQTHKITDDAVFVIISHGRNGLGAYGENLTSISSSKEPFDADEEENFDITILNLDPTNTANFDNNFINKSFDNETFDDMLFFKTRDEIVMDFKAHNKVYCLDTTVSNGREINHSDYNHTDDYDWPNSLYHHFVESSNDCPTDVETGNNSWQKENLYPIKRCGILGKWDTQITVNCKEDTL
ncbi:MAG: type II secretion system protein [Rickettsiales bacterium]|nr:type II secretion system protein [Rickettsiales bacterium]